MWHELVGKPSTLGWLNCQMTAKIRWAALVTFTLIAGDSEVREAFVCPVTVLACLIFQEKLWQIKETFFENHTLQMQKDLCLPKKNISVWPFGMISTLTVLNSVRILFTHTQAIWSPLFSRCAHLSISSFNQDLDRATWGTSRAPGLGADRITHRTDTVFCHSTVSHCPHITRARQSAWIKTVVRLALTYVGNSSFATLFLKAEPDSIRTPFHFWTTAKTDRPMRFGNKKTPKATQRKWMCVRKWGSEETCSIVKHNYDE